MSSVIKAPSFDFRRANVDDLEILKLIFSENSIKNGGNLFCEDSAPSIENIDHVYVLDCLRFPVGYVVLEELNVKNKDISKSIMFSHSLDSSFIYIKQCAIKKDLRGLGYGKTMYNSLFNAFPFFSFYSHVSVKNLESLKFHYSNGFSKIGCFHEENFHESGEDYFSDLVYRPSVVLPDSNLEKYNNCDTLIEQLITLRKGLGLTQGDISYATGLSQQMISKFEVRGGYPSLKNICKYANALSAKLVLVENKNIV